MILFVFILLFSVSAIAEGPSLGNDIDVAIQNDFYLTSEAIADGVSYGYVLGEYTNSSGVVDWESYNSDLSSFLGGSWDVNQVEGMDGWGSEVMQSAPLEAYSSLNFSNIQKHAKDIGLGSYFTTNVLNATNQPSFAISTNLGTFSTTSGYNIPGLSSNLFAMADVDLEQVYFDFSQIHGLEHLGRIELSGTTVHRIGLYTRYAFIVVRFYAFFIGCVSLWGVARDVFA